MAEGSAPGPRVFRRAVADDLRDVQGAIAWAGKLASDAGLSSEVTYAVELCLEEALANLIVHGRADRGAKAVRLAFSAEAGTAKVVICDRCLPFDTVRAPVPPGPTSGDMVGGGQGLRLLHAFASHLDYRSDAQENRLTMTFRPASSSAGQA